jgi:tricorn protease-like protein
MPFIIWLYYDTSYKPEPVYNNIVYTISIMYHLNQTRRYRKGNGKLWRDHDEKELQKTLLRITGDHSCPINCIIYFKSFRGNGMGAFWFYDK